MCLADCLEPFLDEDLSCFRLLLWRYGMRPMQVDVRYGSVKKGLSSLYTSSSLVTSSCRYCWRKDSRERKLWLICLFVMPVKKPTMDGFLASIPFSGVGLMFMLGMNQLSWSSEGSVVFMRLEQ